nr:unnamed protein product [Callosobruchus chinensis]
MQSREGQFGSSVTWP